MNVHTERQRESHVWVCVYGANMRESSRCQLSFSANVFSFGLLSANTMASVISLPIRWSRLKITNLKQLTRSFSTNSSINRGLNSGQSYWWYLLGGSVCAGVYLKWQQSTTVNAFNLKKIKVSVFVKRDVLFC